MRRAADCLPWCNLCLRDRSTQLTQLRLLQCCFFSISPILALWIIYKQNHDLKLISYCGFYFTLPHNSYAIVGYRESTVTNFEITVKSLFWEFPESKILVYKNLCRYIWIFICGQDLDKHWGSNLVKIAAIALS